MLGARLGHLGAMLARLEAMLAQHARKKRHKTNKKANTNKNAAQKPGPHATGGSPPGSLQSAAVLKQGWPSYGGHVGLRWGLCRRRRAMLGRSGPYAAPSWFYVGAS